jgi:hypothetical protein
MFILKHHILHQIAEGEDPRRNGRRTIIQTDHQPHRSAQGEDLKSDAAMRVTLKDHLLHHQNAHEEDLGRNTRRPPKTRMRWKYHLQSE